MSLQEILGITGGALFILLTFVEIAPIKINPWKFIARKVGSFLNAETNEKLDEYRKETNKQIAELKDDIQNVKNDIGNVNSKVNDIEQANEENSMVQARIRILRFSDELRHNMNNTDYFSKDHFDQVMRDIDTYETYCSNHKDFKNNIANSAIKSIKSKYEENITKGIF